MFGVICPTCGNKTLAKKDINESQKCQFCRKLFILESYGSGKGKRFDAVIPNEGKVREYKTKAKKIRQEALLRR